MQPFRLPVLLRAAVPTTVVLALLGLSGGAAARPLPRDTGPIFALRAASAAPELAVSFEETAVTVSEATPGGDVAFFSVAREPQGFFQRVVRRGGVVLADALGEARFELSEGEPVPLKSVWGIVDMASGHFAVAAPEGFRLRQIPFPGDALEAGAPGVVNRLRNRAEAVDVLVARPAVGIWTLRAWDLSPEDRDGRDDDQVLVSVGDLRPLEATGPDPPERFARDDVVIVILPETLRYYAARLVGPPVGVAP